MRVGGKRRRAAGQVPGRRPEATEVGVQFVRAQRRGGDLHPEVTETLGPSWGYHLGDVNLAPGNLVDDVRRQEARSVADRR